MSNIKEAIISAWHQAWDLGNYDALSEIAAPEYERVTAQTGKRSGLGELQAEIAAIRAAFPDLKTEIDHIVLEEERGAIYWHTTGTFTASLGDVPATGQEVVTRGANFIRLNAAGQITSEEVTWDASSLLADLGLKSLSSAFEQHDLEGTVIEDFSGEPSRDALKAFNRQFITGVTVVTTIDADGKPRGLALNSFNSVSLDPPLVLVCVQKTSSTYPALFSSKFMGINILSREQRDTLGVFASKAADKFAQIDWHQGEHGSPLIDGSSASIEVEIKERFQALTHTVFIGRVRSAEASEDMPIIYKAGKFFDSDNLKPLD